MHTHLKRRQFVGFLFANAASLGLAGCGGGGGDEVPIEEAVATSKPLMTYFGHHVTPVQQSALELVSSGLASAPDRFAVGATCSRFGGPGSVATATLPAPSGVTGDFALACWMRTTQPGPMRMLALRAGDAVAVALDINDNCAVRVVCSGAQASLDWGGAGGLADGRWHMLVVQQSGERVELYVDGAAVDAMVHAVATRPFTTLQAGGTSTAPWQGDLDDVRVHDRSFTSDEVLSLVYCWKQVKPNNHADGLAAFYPFAGDAINNTGKGLDGTLWGVRPTADRFGNSANAFFFDGQGAYIEITDSFDRPNDDYAVCVWARTQSLGRQTALSISPGDRDIAFVVNGDAGAQVVLDGNFAILSAGNTGEFADGAWHLILLQRRGTELQFFIDGVMRASSYIDVTAHGPGSRMCIGRSSGADGRPLSFWSGSLDDVQVYERSFTPKEIAELGALQFRPRDGAGILSFQGAMWMLGGWNPDDGESTNSEVWTSVDGSNWRFVCHAPWEGRHTAGWLVANGKMWVVGGDRNRGHYQNDVWCSANGSDWELVTDQVPWADRATHYCVAFADRLWLMGGQQIFTGAEPVAYSDVYSTSDGRTWRLETPQAPWSPRGLILGSVVFRGRMWILGGGTYDTRTYQNDVWSTGDGVNWTLEIASAPWAGRQYHSVTVFDGKIWVVAGGQADQPGGSNQVWCSQDGRNWVPVPDTPWSVRHAAAVCVHDNKLWLATGSYSAVLNDVWHLEYAA